VLNVWVESRECFIEVHIDNWCKIIIIYNHKKFLRISSQTEKFRKDPILSTFAELAGLKPQLKTDSVFLRVSPHSGKPLFATQLPDDVDVADVERRFDASFVDMRVAMFLVGENHWYLSVQSFRHNKLERF